jgi:hypothetical protein
VPDTLPVIDQTTPPVVSAVAVDATQTNANALAGRVDQAVTDLRTIANGTGTLTTAQLSTAVRTIAKVLLVAVRIQFNRLDATD